jgi:Restriction endonuclease
MPTYDFTRLSAFDFEELVADLLRAEWKSDLEIFTPGPDAGIDLRAFSDSKKETLVQCKHFPQTTFSKLLAHLKKEELPKVRRLAPQRYVVATSLGLTPANVKTLVGLFKPYLKRQSDVFGRDRLNSLLRRHKAVETANFKLWLTSTAVMQRVLHNAEHSQTQFEVDRVNRKVPLFVQNEAFPRAQQILEDSRVVVISGEPGIGKTTLAEMLLFAHLAQGFEPVVIEGGIEEGKRLFDPNAKQIFYFDDFLGETFLPERPELLAKNQDSALLHFMEAVRRSKASRFVLTTREHILRTALSSSERLRHGSLISHRCLLELRDYSFGQKARILYNHLFFSELPAGYKAAILQSAFYLRVIRHRNFNPRLIEWLSGYGRVKDIPASGYQEHVSALLNNPGEIWAHAFDNQISEAGRNVLFTLATVQWSAEVDVLEAAWRALHDFKSKKYNFRTTANDFKRSLNDLEGSFLKISDRKVSFINASIRDFVQNLFRNTAEYGHDLIGSAVHFSQIRILRDLQKDRDSETLNAILTPALPLLEALKRVITVPHLRWQKDSNGRATGTYFDDAPDNRLRTIIRWAEDTKSMELLGLVSLAYDHLQKSFGGFIPGMLEVLRTLETSAWVYTNGGAALHAEIMDAVLEMLGQARTYDWRSVFDYRATASGWTAKSEARFATEYQDYRRKGVFDEVEDCNELSDLETMRDTLRDIQKSHKQVFKNVIKRLNVAIDKTRKSMDEGVDDDYQPVSQSKQAGPDDIDAVHRLFGSLL